jgi:hypothetical protein
MTKRVLEAASEMLALEVAATASGSRFSGPGSTPPA